MQEGLKGPTVLSDHLVKEYFEKRKITNNEDVYSMKQESDDGEVHCRFKRTCYTFKNSMGDCPCGLNESP